MFHRARQRVSEFASDWAGPIGLGLAAATTVWIIWYFTKPACTVVATANGLCNPGVLARFITVEILLQSGGAALAAGALKGGYDRYMMRRMLNEAREARQQAEQQLAEQRKRNDENFARLIELREEALRQANAEREESSRVLAEMLSEFREERRQSTEERRQSAEERQQNASTQQALLETIVRLTEQRNGRQGDAPDA